MPLRRSFFSPGRTLLGTTLIAIGIGTLLLAIPFAQTTSHSLIDLIFTATSATCVTGLLQYHLLNLLFLAILLFLF